MLGDRSIDLAVISQACLRSRLRAILMHGSSTSALRRQFDAGAHGGPAGDGAGELDARARRRRTSWPSGRRPCTRESTHRGSVGCVVCVARPRTGGRRFTSPPLVQGAPSPRLSLSPLDSSRRAPHPPKKRGIDAASPLPRPPYRSRLVLHLSSRRPARHRLRLRHGQLSSSVPPESSSSS